MSKAYTRLLSYLIVSLILIIILNSKITSATIVNNPVYIQKELLSWYRADQGTSVSITVAVVSQPGGQSSGLTGTTDTHNEYAVALDNNFIADSGAPQGQYVMEWASSTSSPTNGWVSFSGGSVHVGDSVMLTLSIVNGAVVATATDLNNPQVTASHTTSAQGATQFLGDEDSGGFTGLISQQTFSSGWYAPGTQIETYTLPAGTSSQTATVLMSEFECTNPPMCTTGENLFITLTDEDVEPDPTYIMNNNGMVSEYFYDGTFETGLYSSLAISLDNPQLQGSQADTITASQVADALQYKKLVLNGPGGRILLGTSTEPSFLYSYTLCNGGNSVCPDIPGTYTVNVVTIDDSDLANQTASTTFTVEPPGINAQICPNDNLNNGGPINTFNGTPTSTGTMPPQCGTQCPNNAFNPLPEGYQGVGTEYCNVFCPNGQDNYYQGCNKCPNGLVSTGQCSQYCFDSWGLLISPDSVCAGFGTPLNYTGNGNCYDLIGPTNATAYNNGVHHDLAGSSGIGSGSGGINTGFGGVPFGDSGYGGIICNDLQVNNTNTSILIGRNTISNTTAIQSNPLGQLGGFLNHLFGTTSSITTTIKTAQ